ncbi:MAG: hypothetical protein ACOCZ8_02990 [Bacteroidota bacterium]
MRSPLLWNLLVILAASVAVFAYYPAVITAPNTWMLGDNEDAIKNYFTPAWHVQHDSTYSRFQAMNYPQGEQVTFPDAQPYVSNVLRFVNHNLFSIQDYTVGILNLLMMLSAVLGCFSCIAFCCSMTSTHSVQLW